MEPEQPNTSSASSKREEGNIPNKISPFMDNPNQARIEGPAINNPDQAHIEGTELAILSTSRIPIRNYTHRQPLTYNSSIGHILGSRKGFSINKTTQTEISADSIGDLETESPTKPIPEENSEDVLHPMLEEIEEEVTTMQWKPKIRAQIEFILGKLFFMLLGSFKNFIAAWPIFILIFLIWAYAFEEPETRLTRAIEELTKDLKLDTNSWWFQ